MKRSDTIKTIQWLNQHFAKNASPGTKADATRKLRADIGVTASEFQIGQLAKEMGLTFAKSKNSRMCTQASRSRVAVLARSLVAVHEQLGLSVPTELKELLASMSKES